MTRVNIYAEELLTETELVIKRVSDKKFGDRQFYGLRIYLASPDVLHHSPEDDDRSAITFFVPWTKETGHQFHVVEEALNGLRSQLYKARQTEAGKANDEWLANREANI